MDQSISEYPDQTSKQDSSPLRECLNCCKVLVDAGTVLTCQCDLAVYCSTQCKQEHRLLHSWDCKSAYEQQMLLFVEMQQINPQVHGLRGLMNLGNSSMMNSVLQCLSNTQQLTSYFLSRKYQNEINPINPLSYKGLIVKAYAKFIKGIWCEKSLKPYAPKQFRASLSKIHPKYASFDFYDLQEYIIMMLDVMHEQLNRVKKKPYLQVNEEENTKPEETIATDHWISYLRRNQSIISELMVYQQKVEMGCPSCQKTYLSFDPSYIIKLPIPKHQHLIPGVFIFLSTNIQYPHQHLIPGVFIFKGSPQKPRKINLSYDTFEYQSWMAQIEFSVCLEQKQFVAFFVSRKQELILLKPQSMDQLRHRLQKEGQEFRLVALELNYQRETNKSYSFIKARISRKIKYKSNYKVLSYFPVLLHKDNRCENIINQLPRAQNPSQSSMLSNLDKETQFYLNSTIKQAHPYQDYVQDVSKQLQINKDDRIQSLLSECAGRYDILDIRLSENAVAAFDYDKMSEFYTVLNKIHLNWQYELQAMDLMECVNAFELGRTLKEEEAWYCPTCKEHKKASISKRIYRVPQIMIIHLDRFKYQDNILSKNMTKVVFPLEIKIRTPLMRTYRTVSAVQEVLIASDKCNSHNGPEQPIYDLIAVVNQFGVLGGGHFTATCKNKGKWYSIDDIIIKQIDENQVVSEAACVLFYERRDQP